MSLATITAPSAENQKKLNKFVTYDPEVMHTSNTRWCRFWQVVALISAIAFTALATFAIVYTTMHFPIHLPTVSIIVFAAGMPTSFQIFSRLWDKKEYYAKEAAIDKKLIEFSKKFTSTETKYNGVELHPDFNQKKLSSLLARCAYYELEAMNFFKDFMKMTLQLPVKFLKDVDFSDKKSVEEFDKLQALRIDIYNTSIKGAISAIKAAYCLHLSKYPHDTRLITDFFKIKQLDYTERLVARSFGDSSSEVIISTPEKDYTAFEILDLSSKGIKRLMEEIFEPELKKQGFFSWLTA